MLSSLPTALIAAQNINKPLWPKVLIRILLLWRQESFSTTWSSWHLTNLSKHYLLSCVYFTLPSLWQTLQAAQQVLQPRVPVSNEQSCLKPQVPRISSNHQIWKGLHQDTASPARRFTETQLAGEGREYQKKPKTSETSNISQEFKMF